MMSKDALTVRVSSIRRESADVKSFRLVRPSGEVLPSFAAGSHIDVHLPSGLVRQYSLCNGPGDRTFYEIAVKREANSRGGSEAMCVHMKEGELIKIGSPRNNFSLVEDASCHLLIAAGIGVTPLLSMARHLAAAKRPFRLHYFVRSTDHAALLDRLENADFANQVFIHCAIPPESLSSYVQDMLEAGAGRSHIYLCGPRAFMDTVKRVADKEWPASSVHIENFSADVAALANVQSSFEVRLARSGATYLIPENKTIVEVLLEHGIMIDVSCEQGVCGTCLTRVLEGTPEHRDVYLTDEERASGALMTPCVSRATSRCLVLDL